MDASENVLGSGRAPTPASDETRKKRQFNTEVYIDLLRRTRRCAAQENLTITAFVDEALTERCKRSVPKERKPVFTKSKSARKQRRGPPRPRAA